jgi:hypothetical protein
MTTFQRLVLSGLGAVLLLLLVVVERPFSIDHTLILLLRRSNR